ncbi:hypothetical protein PsorP6_008167 [Peronosclerospora sorghi]|uniref:Uncharacterized protein n=1 Tax=Peronosclerospora sorghi TaxID=230839 RepID=A0ACC0W909_9STRA|nr:hypothetical protein PsorP6_008167 [Peronosclerospora sorghi]
MPLSSLGYRLMQSGAHLVAGVSVVFLQLVSPPTSIESQSLRRIPPSCNVDSNDDRGSHPYAKKKMSLRECNQGSSSARIPDALHTSSSLSGRHPIHTS